MKPSVEELLASNKRPIEIVCEFHFLDVADSSALGKLVVDEKDQVSFTIYRDVVHSAGEKALHTIVHATCNGSLLTLLNCHTGGPHYSKDLPYEEYSCSSMFVGSHLEPSDLNNICRYSFTFDELAIWLNVPLFECDHEGAEDRYTVSSTREFFPIVECDDENVRVSLNAQYSGPVRGSTVLTATKTPWMHSTIATPVSVEELHRRLLRWHDLFTFICFQEITWGAIFVGIKNNEKMCRWLSPRYKRRTNVSHRLHATDMLFDCDDGVNQADMVFARWVQLYEKNASSIRLFCSTFAGNSYHEYRFLSLVQALESYQYSTIQREIISKTEYRGIFKGLCRSVEEETNEELRNAIISRLRYAYTVTLSGLLKTVFDTVAEYFPETYFVSELAYDRIERIKKSRNNFIHGGKLVPHVKNNSYDEVFDDAEFLRYMFLAIVAKEACVSEASIRKSIARKIHDHSVSTLLMS